MSSDEYDSLKRVCLESGSRSISDFARAAVLDRVGNENRSANLLTEDLTTLGRRLEELDESMKFLRGRIGRVLGSHEEEPPADEVFDRGAELERREM